MTKGRVIVVEKHRDGKGLKKKVITKEYDKDGKKIREKEKKYHRDK